MHIPAKCFLHCSLWYGFPYPLITSASNFHLFQLIVFIPILLPSSVFLCFLHSCRFSEQIVLTSLFSLVYSLYEQELNQEECLCFCGFFPLPLFLLLFFLWSSGSINLLDHVLHVSVLIFALQRRKRWEKTPVNDWCVWFVMLDSNNHN